MNTQLRQRDFSLFTPKKSSRVHRITGGHSQDTIKKTEKQSNSLFFCIFLLYPGNIRGNVADRGAFIFAYWKE